MTSILLGQSALPPGGEGPPSHGRKPSTRRSFRPLFELGRGGMARVYLAESLASGIQKLVVLKILNHELARDAAVRAAFLREAVISGRMNHRNVVQVHEVLEHDATDVIVMEYVDGFSLSRIVQDAGPRLSVRLHLSIVLQMLAGLHHFHELSDLDGSPLWGVHRDVSPHNVLVSYDGQAKVADFGIAKINAPAQFATQTGLVKGKIHYMAPEQIVADEVDRRTDVFAAGVLLWEALAQRRMWSGVGAARVMRSLTEGRVPDLGAICPDVPPALLEVAARATKPNPGERYATALEMLEATERAMAETTGIAPQRELSEFMASAFGEIRAIRQQSVNHALRHPELAPLGILDCWTSGYAAQGRGSVPPSRRLRLDSPLGIADDLADTSVLHGGASPDSTLFAELPQVAGSTSTAVETARVNEPRRRTRKRWLGLLAAAAAVTALMGFVATRKPEKVSASPSEGDRAAASGSGEAAAPPSAPPPAAPAPPSAATDSGVSADEINLEDDELERPAVEPPGSGHSHGRRRPYATASPRNSASSSAPDCSPPYRILASGIKRFKLECFPAGGAPAKP